MDQTFLVDQDNTGSRLDIFLSNKIEQSRTQAQKIIKENRVLVNNVTAKKTGQFLTNGDIVLIIETEASASAKKIEKSKSALTPSSKKLSIIEDNNEFLIVEKPAGLLVHPTQANESDTLAGRLIFAYPEIQSVGEDPVRPGMVHRLDKEASGLLVIAKTQKMFNHLKKQFQNRTVEKEYEVLVYGEFENESGIIDFDIDRGKDGRMVSRPKIEFSLKNLKKIQPGKTAITKFAVKKIFPRYTLLKVKIKTGRMHQIRVHMFAFNHPVVGDTLYENKNLLKKNDIPLGRLFLHATHLCFNNLKCELVCFNSTLPDELQTYLNRLN